MKEAIIQYNEDPNNDSNHMVISWKPLVRCKDCKYWHETIYDTPKWMPCMSVQTSGNWFCADGKRRDDDA